MASSRPIRRSPLGPGARLPQRAVSLRHDRSRAGPVARTSGQDRRYGRRKCGRACGSAGLFPTSASAPASPLERSGSGPLEAWCGKGCPGSCLVLARHRRSYALSFGCPILATATEHERSLTCWGGSKIAQRKIDPPARARSQIGNFKEAARELGCDEDEARWMSDCGRWRRLKSKAPSE